MKRYAIALILVLLAAGCFGRYQQPEIRFEGVRLGGLGLRGGTVYARLQVVNPNGFALRASALTYDLELAEDTGGEQGWVRLAEGTFAERVEVASHDSTVVEVPIEFTYEGLGGALSSMLDRGTLDYRISGTVQVTDPVRRNVPYRRTGKVSLAGAR